MQKNKTVLDKIGITDKVVKDWKAKGLKITYPMKKNKRYFMSQDGEVFIEGADKYVPLLTKKETILYTKHPEKFKNDFLKNVRFCSTFHAFLYAKSQEIEKLENTEEKLTASLALMYLFLSAMDHHYYHYDRYLVYQEYPETPVGYWWKRLKELFIKIFKETDTTNFLKVLAKDPEILKEFQKRFSKTEFQEFNRILAVIKIFEYTQQKEYKIISGYPSKEDLLLKTGFGLWNNICDLIKKHPASIREQNCNRILRLIEGHPIVSTRQLLLIPQLKAFKAKIFSGFEEEVKRWL